MADNVLPQHDLDEQKRIRWEITQKGYKAIAWEVLKAKREAGLLIGR